MQRLIFYGIIVLIIVLFFALFDFIIYRVLRLGLTRQTAQTVNYFIVIILTLTIGISSWWGNTHTRLAINITHTEIPSKRLPDGFDGYKIAQISDLHLDSFGEEEGRLFLSRLADSIAAQAPDLIVFTGDMVTIRAAQAYPFREGLKKISHIKSKNGNETIPVYSILGNHDYADYMRNFTEERKKQDLDSLVRLQKEAGWIPLRNETVIISKTTDNENDSINIALVGVENIGEPPFSVYGDLELAMKDIQKGPGSASPFTILLSHNPTHWRKEVLNKTEIDLMLCGHTHATQIRIASWSPAKWKYDEWMGHYKENEQHLYVNTGIGCVGPKVRIGVPPEISLITLRKE